MGNHCLGIIFGAPADPFNVLDEDGDDWEPILPNYNCNKPWAERPHTSENWEIVGFWVAVGGGGLEGVPYLGNDVIPFPFDQETNPSLWEAVLKAKTLWAPFQEWCAIHGIFLDAPKLYLVPTTTA